MKKPIVTRAQLMEDTVVADAYMLLSHLRDRAAAGDLRPITTLEALNAIHRPQPAGAVIPREAAHMARVVARLRAMLPIDADNRADKPS